MDSPRNGDIDRALARILKEGIVIEPANEPTMLDPEDEAYLRDRLKDIRAGKPGIVIAESEDGRLRFLFSNMTRAEAMMALGEVIKATGQRLKDGEN